MKAKIIFCLLLCCTALIAQTKGTIYSRVAAGTGQKVLDPNNDGFVSLTSAGFSGTDDSGVNSELRMIPIPVFQTEPPADLTAGPSNGFTDIVSSPTNQSCYILKTTVDGVNYFVVRFRLGGASAASKGYTLLIDSDNTFGAPGLSATNLGFDREIVLETGNNGRVAIYRHTLNNNATLMTSYPINTNSQRSIAASTIGGDSDYFYDFFVPLSALEITGPVRFASATVISANSGIGGNTSDFGGVNDAAYGNNNLLIAQALISTFPSVSLNDLDDNFDTANFVVKTSTPSVNPGLAAGATSISGTSTEANGTIITIFKNGVSIGTATVTNNAWTISGITALVGGDSITASAIVTGKTASNVSSAILVSSATQDCFIPSPATIADRSNQTIRGTYSGTVATATSIRIQLYTQTGPLPGDIVIFNHATVYVPTVGGAWAVPTGLAQNTFNVTNFIAVAISATCQSGFSNVSQKTNGQVGTTTPTPTVTTTTILQSNTSQTITVANNGLSANASILILYVNGTEVARTPSAIAANGTHNFTVTGLSEGDVVTARAQSTTVDYWISNVSNAVPVTLSNPTQSTSPVITGSYAAGAGQTIRGTSTEAAGTIIEVFRNGVSIGTTTVSAFGTWQITGVTLTASDTLRATAKADSESVSAFSNTVTVTPTPPSAPVVSGPLVVESTTISGTSGSGLVQIFADGALIGTATPSGGNWSFPVPTGELYKGAQITARNLVSGSTSVASNIQTVTGVGGFCITLSDGSPLPSPINSGETYSLRITAITGTTCPGTPYTGYTGTVSLSGNNFISPSGTTANFVGGVLTTSVTFGGSGSTTITAINPSDPSVVGTATTNVNTSALWVGSISTDFNTAGNWSGNYVPGPGADITFASNVQRDCVLDTNRLIGNLDFNNGGHSFKFVLGANTLENRGTISNSTVNKSITSSTSSKLLLSGYGASGPVFFTAGSTIDELILNKTNSGSITVGSPVRVLSLLNVLQGALNANGNITIASTNDRTAVVPAVGGTITGNVIVEKFIPASRRFRFLTSSVNAGSINANWQEGMTNATTSNNINTLPGYGTHITGNGQNGLDATQTTNFSMFTYTNATQQWAQVGNTLTTNLTAGAPFRILVRGDRSINLNNNAPTPTSTTLRTTGTLVVGDFTIPASSLNQNAGTFSFIGNPYQAQVNLKEVLAGTNFFTQVWFWNPRVNSRGAYVPVDFSDAVTDLVTPGAAGNRRIVMPGSSFFVRKQSATSSSIVFQESHKLVTTSNAALFRQAQPTTNATNSLDKISISLHENNNVLPTDNILDGILLAFSNNFDSQFTDEDVMKLSNLDEDFAVYHGTNRTSIDKRSNATVADVIDLGITKYRYASYKFKISANEYDGLTPYLADNYLNTFTKLTPGATVEYPFTVDAQLSETTSLNRFKIVFEAPLSNSTFDRAITLYPNPAKTNSSFYLVGVTDATVKMYNFLGQNIPLKTELVGQALQITPNVATATGVYIVSITTEGKTSQVKWIVE